MKHIVLTGGGTAGHVTPNIALLPSLEAHHYKISYIGSHAGMEKDLIEQQNIDYYGISSGKLRRYIDIKNLFDPFKVMKGYFQALALLRKLKPDVVFSKGGFVTVPVILAAKTLGIPAIIHESDMTPGLANKIAIPAARKVCCNFPETLAYLPKEKAVLTGSPIRSELLLGNPASAREHCKFTLDKPVLLSFGGSTGSKAINQALRDALPSILKEFQIIHLCGKNNLDESLENLEGYVQFEYASEELKDYFSLADLVISRAGANSICELLALKKPNILIPLSASASRGDQILNANSFKKQGYSYVLEEEALNTESLLTAINEVQKNRLSYIQAMEKSSQNNGVGLILETIESVVS